MRVSPLTESLNVSSDRRIVGSGASSGHVKRSANLGFSSLYATLGLPVAQFPAFLGYRVSPCRRLGFHFHQGFSKREIGSGHVMMRKAGGSVQNFSHI